jgi:hypothetical protein
LLSLQAVSSALRGCHEHQGDTSLDPERLRRLRGASLPKTFAQEDSMRRWTLSVGALILGLGVSTPASAALDNAAAEVLLRTTCTDNGATLNNCFTSVSALETWIWNTRNPSSSNPLHVRIGPGAFTGNLSCSGSTRGHTTYTGAGINNSIIFGTVSSTDCVNQTYESFSIHYGGIYVVATSGGLTVWKNVEVVGAYIGWLDAGSSDECPDDRGKPPGKHYWFGSRITSTALNNSANGHAALFWICKDEQAWLFGSEISSMSKRNWDSGYAIQALAGEIHVYGGVIRNVPEPEKTVAEMFGVVAGGEDHADVHIHGTGIDVIAQGANTLYALGAAYHGHIHANASAYNLKTGTGGTITRILTDSNGEVMAPYLWQNGTPPAIISKTGADMVVVPVSGVPHMLIYKLACSGSSNWYDTHTQACY